MAGSKKAANSSGSGSSGTSEAGQPTTSTPIRQSCAPSTSGGAGDELPTVVSTQVKVHIKLQTLGKNVRLWDQAFRAANEQKGSLPAVLEAMPGTIHNSAALLLLYESISEDLHGELSGMTTAFDAYNYVFCKFNGGTNIEANNDLLKEMAAGMKHDETITQYVNRMLTLKECLRGNNHPLMDEHVAIQIVQGLPAAAKDGGEPVHSHSPSPPQASWSPQGHSKCSGIQRQRTSAASCHGTGSGVFWHQHASCGMRSWTFSAWI
jgi:hypothetical protein